MSSPEGNLAIIAVVGTALAAVIGLLLHKRNSFFSEQRQNYTNNEAPVNMCFICCQQLQTGQALPCGHKFHKDCLREVLQRQIRKSCPYCRKCF